MKVFLLGLTAFILSFYANSTDSKFDWSTPQPVSNNTPDTEILGKLAGTYFVMRFNYSNTRRGILIESYNPQMRFVNKKDFASSRNTYFVKAFLTQKNIIAIYNEYDRRENKATYYAKIINHKLEVVSNKVILETFASNLQDANNKLNISLSKDRTTIFVYFQNHKQPNKYNFLLLNDLAEVKSNAELEFDINANFEIIQSDFTQDFLAFLISGEKRINKQTEKILFLYKYDLESQNLKQYQLFDENNYAVNGKIKFDHINNKLGFSGIYKNIIENDHEGFLQFNIDLNETDSNNIYFFNASEHNIYIKDGGNLPRISLENFYIYDVIYNNLGGSIVIAEFYEVTQKLYQDFPAYGVSQSYVRNHYLYQEVLIVSFDKNMNVEWTQIVKKDQNSVNDRGSYSSFTLSVLAREIGIIYNDLTRINWNVFEIGIDLSGNLNRKLLMSNNEFDGRLIPQLGVQVASDEILIPGILNRKGHVVLRIRH